MAASKAGSNRWPSCGSSPMAKLFRGTDPSDKVRRQGGATSKNFKAIWKTLVTGFETFRMDARQVRRWWTKCMRRIHYSANGGWSNETSNTFYKMAKKLGLCIVVVGLLLDATTSRAADKIRVAFPSLATALSPSWITADKGMWRKYGLEVTTNTLGYALVTPQSIKTIRDLKGKTLGIPLGRVADYDRLVKVLLEN